MKKLLLSILSFIIIITCITVHASERDTYSDELIDAVGLLNVLNIVDDNIEDTDFSAGITRAEFLQKLSGILNVKEDSNTDINYFKDMEGHWAVSIVNYFVEAGIISVTDERIFRPDDFIVPSEAYKILVTLTGYGVQAENRGGYPTGHILTAKMINIVPNTINNHDYLTIEDAYLLIYNTINIPLYGVDSVSGSDVSYKVEEEKSLLSMYHNVYYDEGYVYSTSGLSINDLKSRENEIVVDEELYFIDESLYAEYYLGKYVKLYYVDNKDSSKKVIYITCDDKQGDYIEIDAKLIEGLDKDYRLKYYNDKHQNKILSKKLSRTVSIIYNGKKIEKDFIKIFDELKNGYVRLLDVDGDNKYEYAIVKSYTDVVVGYYDKQEDTIYDELSGNSINFSDCKNVAFYSVSYSKIARSSLVEGMILSIAYSEGVYLEGIVSKELVSGCIEEIEKCSDTSHVIIEDKEYSVGNDYARYFDNRFFVGDSITAYLNVFSEIAYIEVLGDSDFSFGYMCDLNIGKGLSGLLQIKMFCEDGSMKIFDVAEKVIVDGKVLKNNDDIVNAMPGCFAENNIIKDYEPQAIRYRFNTEREICEIDTKILTGLENVRDSLAKTVTYSNKEGSDSVIVSSQGTNLRRLGMSTIINASTIIFVIPEFETIKNGEAEDYQFKLGSIAKDLVPDTYVTIDSYRTDVFNGYEELLVIYSDGIIEWDARVNLMVVDKITKGVDINNNLVFRLKGMRGGKRVEYDVSPEYNPVDLPDSGDTIGIETNVLDQITYIKILYDLSAGGTPKSQEGSDWATDNRYFGGGSYFQEFQCSFMYASYTKGTILKCCYDNTTSDYITYCDEAIDTTNFCITVYDASLANNNLYLGNINDVRSIYNVGADKCSKILVHSRYRSILDVIVYK